MTNKMKDLVKGILVGLAGKPLEFAPEQPTAFFYGHVAKDGETPTHIIDGVDYVGKVAPDIYTVYTPELQVQYSYACIVYYSSDTPIRLIVTPDIITAPYKDDCIFHAMVDTFLAWEIQDDVWVKDTPYVVKGPVIWAKSDIYYDDTLYGDDVEGLEGTIYLSAIDPIPIYGPPKAFRYNGVRLPPLPEWDKTVYPYALITEVVQGERYHFVAFSTKPGAFPDDRMPEYIWYGTPITDDGATIEYICRTTDNDGWVFHDDSSYFRDPLFNLLWADHDALNTDEKLYLAASEPVPIYE
jgi:hypothetical protein